MPTSSDRASPAFAISTWSLHRRLGITYPNGPARDGRSEAVPTYGAGSVTLLDLPAEIAKRGIERVEICHFHLPAAIGGFSPNCGRPWPMPASS